MDCKLEGTSRSIQGVFVLIYPEWIVNNCTIVAWCRHAPVLIYPEWIVNRKATKQAKKANGVLIYPEWIVNQATPSAISSASPM